MQAGVAARPRRADTSGINWFKRANPLVEVAWVAAVFSAILFSLPLGPFTPAIIIALLPVFVVLRWETLPKLIRDSWPLMLLPGLVLLSALWSDMPTITMRYGIIYLLTVLCGLIMGGAIAPINLLKGMFIGFCVYTFFSLVSFRWVPWNGPGGQAFAGLAGSKNSAGDVAALTTLTILAIIAWAALKQRPVWLVVALLNLPLALFILWFAHATGALIACVLAIGCLSTFLLSRRLPIQGRATIFVLGTLAVALAAAFQSYWLPAIFDMVLAESGKSSDLTGRVELWAKADELIAARPWFGMGYNTFWVHNNLDAEYLWRLMGIANREGFNFHSTPREILVHLGIVGLALYCLVATIGAGRLLIKTMVQPAVTSIFLCVILIFILPKLAFEVIGFGTMHFSTILLFMILATGFRRNSPQGQNLY